jgi:hypothetical protein
MPGVGKGPEHQEDAVGLEHLVAALDQLVGGAAARSTALM